MKRTITAAIPSALACCIMFSADGATSSPWIGKEVSITRHLQDDEELQVSLPTLLAHGKKLFMANWTRQEGGGRPLTKGTGAPLSDPSDPWHFRAISIGYPGRRRTRVSDATIHRSELPAERATSLRTCSCSDNASISQLLMGLIPFRRNQTSMSEGCA